MKISLKTDWKSEIKRRAKFYSVEVKNKIIIDKTFNKFHIEEKLSWTTKFTFLSFYCFVVWKKSSDNKKNRVIIKIRGWNVVTLLKVYFISLQIDIIQFVNDCKVIFVIDCVEIFYQ